MTLSFVIPVFNGSSFIIRCLNSIYSLNIPLDDFEIIVIDDCSTDNTCSIVEDYIETHLQVILLKQAENHRQGAARNRGLREAIGEYIYFVDADDYVLPALKKSYELTTSSNADMIYGYMEVEKPKGFELIKNSFIPSSTLPGSEFAELFYDQGVFLYPPSYIYRKQFLLDINGFFVENRQHEDRDWLANVLVQANSVIVNPNPIYRYVLNLSSTCRGKRYSTVFDHTASGIRHIRLSHQLQSKCPNLSQTLYSFGVDEIYRSLRLRNLTKFSWSYNKHLYDAQYLRPLLTDLRQVCKSENLQLSVWVVAFAQPIEMGILAMASPVALLGRKIVAKLRNRI